MTEPDATVARWLVTTEGLRLIDAVMSDLEDGLDELAIARRHRPQADRVEHVAAAMSAALARRRAGASWRHTDQLVATREALEQASDPLVSAWRARRFRELTTWDLCAGIGGDALAIGQVTEQLTAVERSPARATMLRHNLEVNGVRATVLEADAMHVEVPTEAVVHADPSRRDGGRRATRLSDYEPSVAALMRRHQDAAGHAVVMSPGVDISDPELPEGELEFVQIGDRLVEAVVWSGRLRTPGIAARASILPLTRPTSVAMNRPTSQPPSAADQATVLADEGHVTSPSVPGEPEVPQVVSLVRREDEPTDVLPVGEVGGYLVEVAAAAIRARLHDHIGRSLDARRVATRRAMLTTDDLPPPSPWYRAREVVTVLAARPRVVRRWLREAGLQDAPIELVFHGVPGEVERWWRELGRPPRGPQGLRIEVLRLDERAIVVVTRAPRD